MTSVEAGARAIRQELRALGPGPRDAHRRSAERDLGVYAKDLAAVLRAWKSRLKTEKAEFVIQLARSLRGSGIRECRQLGCELLAGHAAAFARVDRALLEELGQGMDNWSWVDHFACTLAGPAWQAGQIRDSTVLAWSRSPDLWWRRTALVATVPLNTKSRGGRGDADRTLAVCRELVEDHEEMIEKALSWALRCLAPWDAAAVSGFLAEHGAVLGARIRREVSRKLQTETKRGAS